MSSEIPDNQSDSVVVANIKAGALVPEDSIVHAFDEGPEIVMSAMPQASATQYADAFSPAGETYSPFQKTLLAGVGLAESNAMLANPTNPQADVAEAQAETRFVLIAAAAIAAFFYFKRKGKK